MIASDIMTVDVKTISPNSLIKDALSLMTQYDFRHLPVEKDGVLVGIISDRDIREYLVPFNEEDIEFDVDETEIRMHEKVQSIMHTDVITVTKDTDLKDIIDIFIEEKVGAIPVVDEVENMLIGIISYIDVLKATREIL